MTLYFRNKVAVVTGGASGLGLALCEALLNRQAQVVLADIDGEAAQQQAERLQHGAAQLRAVPLDVTQLAAVKALISDVVRQFGRVDLMFNNAGIGGTLPYPQATREHWERIVQLNLWGVIHGTEAAFGQMKQQGSGQIVNTSSIADLIPFPGHVLYTTTKYAVVGLSTTLRTEAARYGIKVNVVCPGLIQTGIFAVPILGERDPNPNVPCGAIKASAAAQRVLRGVGRNQAKIVFPAQAAWLDYLHRWFPRFVGA